MRWPRGLAVLQAHGAIVKVGDGPVISPASSPAHLLSTGHRKAKDRGMGGLCGEETHLRAPQSLGCAFVLQDLEGTRPPWSHGPTEARTALSVSI